MPGEEMEKGSATNSSKKTRKEGELAGSGDSLGRNSFLKMVGYVNAMEKMGDKELMSTGKRMTLGDV